MKIFDFNRAIVRAPSESVVKGLRASNQADPSLDGIRREHAAYATALERAGLTVTVLPPLEEFPDSVFVEDPALVFTDGAILLRPGAPTREAESAAIGPALRGQFDTVLALADGHADGGDVLVTPGEVFIGLSGRTDAAGAAALVELLARLGYRGLPVRPPPGTLHLKSAASLLDEETILATAGLAASGLLDGFRVLTVPEEEEGAANALRLNDTVLAGAAYPRTIELLDRHGYQVMPLDVTEVGKLDAGLSCMSLRWWSTADEAARAQ